MLVSLVQLQCGVGRRQPPACIDRRTELLTLITRIKEKCQLSHANVPLFDHIYLFPSMLVISAAHAIQIDISPLRRLGCIAA
jgi:hypothetical protein